MKHVREGLLDLKIQHIHVTFISTVKPLNSGHLRVLKSLSVIKRCPLLRGGLIKIWDSTLCHIWDETFYSVYKACPLFEVSAIGTFHCKQVFTLSVYIIDFIENLSLVQIK